MPEKEKLLKKKVKYQENAMLEKPRKTVPRRKGITLSRNDWGLSGLKITLRKFYIKEK